MYWLTLDSYLKERFGGKVYKLALDAGLTCPNRDGTKGTGGCSFCAEGSGRFAGRLVPGQAFQLAEAKALVARKMGRNRPRYMAYFQAFTNTYTTPERLRAILEPALKDPEIVAVSLATRPDCLPPDMLAFLEAVNREKPLWVELGLQTIHDKTAEAFNRGYPYEVFLEACRGLKRAGLETVVHLIFGLPGETRAMMLETVRAAGTWGVQGVKLQLLHVLKNTPLADLYAAGGFKTFEKDAWFEFLADILPLLPPDLVIHRLTGDGPKDSLIAPLWTANKRQVLNEMRAFFKARDVVQGSLYRPEPL